jgi:ABC-type Co2+ transport system permease subunit
VAVAAFRTRVSFDRGTLLHFLYGLAAGWLGAWQSAVATAIFVAKQALDVRGGEDPGETSGDIAEYASGLLAGWLAARLPHALLQLVALCIAAAAAALAVLLLRKRQVEF